MLDYPFDLAEEKAAILAEGSFGALESKFAAAMLRYRSDRAVCVIDSENAGRAAQEAIGIGGNVPVVASLEEAFRLRPTLLVIGIAPPGGALPDSWRAVILSALRHGLHVMSGLHQFLALDAEFAEAAEKSGARIWDPALPPRESAGRERARPAAQREARSDRRLRLPSRKDGRRLRDEQRRRPARMETRLLRYGADRNHVERRRHRRGRGRRRLLSPARRSRSCWNVLRRFNLTGSLWRGKAP